MGSAAIETAVLHKPTDSERVLCDLHIYITTPDFRSDTEPASEGVSENRKLTSE